MDIFSKLNKIIIIIIIIIDIIIIIIIDIIIIAKRSRNTSRLFTPISIKVAPVVNPFVAGSSVLLTFIEIMEIICEEAFKRTLNSNGCENAQE